MNKEYTERMKRAEDAAKQFFEKAKKTDNVMEMFENDDAVKDLYHEVLYVIDDDSDEERDFYIKYANFHLYKGIFLIHCGEFSRQTGNRKSITINEMKPVYDELTEILDAAIMSGGRNKPAYEQRKAEIISTFNEELLKHGITVKKDGCYIATSVYGSYDCPQVWTLRRYRDGVLAHNLWGRAFIRVYYAVSPTLVKWFGQEKWFSSLWRGALDMLICKLKSKGYEDTPYTDLTLQPQQAVHSGSALKLEKEKKRC